MSSTAEEIQEKGRDYVNYINDCLLNICSQSQNFLPIWTNTGDAYNAPRETNIEINGKTIRFDLAYSARRSGISSRALQLFVEAKGSYDRAYIDRSFVEFLDKIFLLKELIINPDWKGARFVFISPIVPTQAEDPRIFSRPSDIKKLLSKINGFIFSEDDDKFIETISKHIFVLQLPMENRLIMLGDD